MNQPAVAPRFHFDKEQHVYTLDGRRLPSVTEIIEPIQAGYAGIPAHVLEKARARGEAVHLAVQYHNEGDLAVETLDIEIVPYFEAYLKFVADTGFKVLGTETAMYSIPFRYAGTPDLWGEIGAELWLPDIKCTAVTPPWTAIQTAAYRRLLEEYTGHKARRGALQLRGDGTYRFTPYPAADDARDMATFNACRLVWDWRKNHL